MLLHLQVSQQRAHRTACAPHPAHAMHTAHGPHSWCTCSLCRSICGRRAVRAAGALVLRGWWSSSPFSFVIRCGKATTHVRASSYGKVILINAASASTTASTHACGATSSGGRVVSGSVRSCLELPVALVPRPTHPGHMPRWLGIMVGCVVERECCLTDGMPSHRPIGGFCVHLL